MCDTAKIETAGKVAEADNVLNPRPWKRIELNKVSQLIQSI